MKLPQEISVGVSIPWNTMINFLKRIFGKDGNQPSSLMAPAASAAAFADFCGRWIANHEARRDSQGRLSVYILPPGDGGGAFEVAGICERYHPEKAEALREMIIQHRYSEAEHEASAYWANVTSDARAWAQALPEKYRQAGEFFLRDCIANRGQGGAVAILQLALGAKVDAKMGPQTAGLMAAAGPSFIPRLREAREKYERSTYQWKPHARDESSKFWRGLVNRWNAAAATAYRIKDGGAV